MQISTGLKISVQLMHALRPAAIGSLQLKNCIVRAATSESLALETGEVTPELIAFHRALAEGGVGLSILGHAYVHHRGKSLAHQTGIHDDALVPGLKSLTTAVHDSGGVIFAQLAHAGSQSGVAPVPLAPSAVPNALTGRVPPAATLDEIHEAIQAFGDAARRAMEAGFDGVHIHAANGYLISEFSSPHANHRADEWGGSAEKRTHFLAAVYDAVRRETGPNVPVTVKLGMEDEVTNGLGLVESAAIVKALANRGIDGVEVSVGLMSAGSDSCRKYVAVDRQRALADHLYHRVFSSAAAEAYFEPFAQAAKSAAPDITIMLVGGMRTTETIERVLAQGSCDLVCLARPLIREPDLVSQLVAGRRGRLDCTSCNMCLDNEGDHALQCWRTPRRRLIEGAVAHIRRRVSGSHGH